MPAKLLFVGLDGADSKRVDRWSADGTLPNLTALRKRGKAVSLHAPPGTTDDSLWASFQYGTGEGSHGRYNYRVVRESGEPAMAVLEEFDLDAFWHRLGARGIRSAILDVPKTAPPKAFNGIHVADWLVHGRYFKQPKSHPLALAEDIVRRFGPAPPSACGYYQDRLSDTEAEGIVENLRLSVARKSAAALDFLALEDWDLFVVCFKECHCAGHGLWNFEDRNHPEFDEARSVRLGWPVRRVFQAVDEALGDVVAAAGREANVVVFSTTEMEPNGSMDHLLPEIVGRLNAELSRANWFSARLRRLRGRSPRAVETHCEMLPHSDNTGALRIHDTRRQGASFRHKKIGRIERLLYGLTDADTGRRILKRISYPSRDRIGEKHGRLPDLLLSYESSVAPSAVSSGRLGRVDGTSRRRRPGNHAMGGIAIVNGQKAIAAVDVLKGMEQFEAFAERILLT